jgi:glutamyl-tRNA synthetase
LEVLTDLNTESVRTEPYTAEDPGRQGQVRGASASEISNSGAFNGDYIRALSPEQFANACAPWLVAPYAPWGPEAFDKDVFEAVAPLAQTRLALLSEITGYVDFLFLDEPVRDEVSWSKAMKAGAGDVLSDARAELAAVADWKADDLKAVLLAVGEKHGLKLGKAQAPIRVAVTGRTIGLPLFESMELLGRDRVLARLDAAARSSSVDEESL